MIFLTVGGQLPFDRLVRRVDEWAEDRQRNDIVAQIGAADYRPRHMQIRPFVSPAEFETLAREANAIVAHAGIGTILTALELGKPLLVLPRLARFREHRNDHQVQTARHFSEAGLVLAALDDEDLPAQLDQLEASTGPERIGPTAPPELIERIRDFAAGKP